MKTFRLAAIFASAALVAMATAAQATPVIIHTTTTTLSAPQGSQGGTNVSGAGITGSFGTIVYSNAPTIIFSTIKVTSDDQGQVFTYDFGYRCVAGAPGCTTAPTVYSQFPGAGGFPVGYSLDTGEIPGTSYPSIGHPTSASALIDFGVEDFVFDSAGKVFATETFTVTEGVPEPAAWALMLIGFGGLGAALRRRRDVLPAA